MDTQRTRSLRDTPAHYRLWLRPPLSIDWSDWFEGLTLTHEGSQTILEGVLPDQAALYGLLSRIRDLGLILDSLQRIERH